MRISTHARLARARALVLAPARLARAQDEEDDPDGGQRFPWLCFTTSLAAIGGLYVLVRRREEAIEEDLRRGRGPEIGWYCRACDREVTGPECPRCGAENPFLHEPRHVEVVTRAGRVASRHGGRGHGERNGRHQECDE
jgi:hypothetical protein